MKKLEEKELNQLTECISKINSLQIQIGGIEAQKHELLHTISSASNDLAELQKELEKKYGKVSIDISTGEIKEDEPNQED